jgi:hypothetical protein
MRRIPLAVILVALILSAGCTGGGSRSGSLEVTSTPAGQEVQVILDGNLMGVTPLHIANLSPGYHQVELYSPGYRNKTEPVTVIAGQTMHISADYSPLQTPAPETSIPSLTPEMTPTPTETPGSLPVTPPRLGSLYVTSFPSGATIYLNGRGYGTTPNLIQNLTPGSYELRLSLVGWEDYRISISVSPGLIHREDVQLRS